ncbi:MAG: ATP-binding protein [Opitutales bacterium]|nr:ATP-binding protein [Opitutales bacterium]MDP4778540.1 ATP-binding protein [Opitutales bacterium]MDP5080821.1 ATP-binding protein [Opitutales bacterium]
MADLEGAVHAQRRLLPEASDFTIKLHGVKGLIDETNDFIDRYQLYATENTGYSKQIEALLRAVQEVVVIFNADREIEFSNKSAESLFHKSMSMKGLRVDSAMRSLSLLEFLEALKEGRPGNENQISIEKEGETLWFEASCSEVRGISNPNAMSYLLVLHDITRLKSLEVLRREFVANVSHELRTPLTIIKGFAETLVDDESTIPSESRVRFLGKILTNAERLHMLVEDLLTLSRLESKADQFDPVMQPILPLLEDIREDYQSRLKEKSQKIVVDVDDAVPFVSFDRFRINQVLDNLVVNAFRYAPDFTELRLSARYDAAEQVVVCSVQDDGPGIPEDDLPHLFERFYRVDKGRSKESGGTGLGLSITKHIIQLHDGKVWAESKLGEWTKVSFSLHCPLVETGTV